MQKVVKKYRDLCRDNGKKRWYPGSDDGLIRIKSSDIAYALKNLNFKKDTGWDYIPKEVFKLILEVTKNYKAERDEFTKNLARLCSELIGNYVLPDEVLSTRLICFRSLYVLDLDRIRPIGINGVLSKIIEILIRNHLRRHKYCNKLI